MRRYLQLCVVVVTVLALASPAWAVPAKFTQQGRLLDLNGQPLTGTHALFFALYDAETGGVEEWFEYHSTVFDNGYYTVSLGEQIPLDEALFSGASLWLEISVDGTVLSPRQEVAAVPWALRASSAESIDGGAVDASRISIDGSEVINSSGAWVGPALTVDWNNIAGIPADLADGDQDSDSLGLLLCSEGQVAKWTSDAWACADDVDTVTSSLPWTSLTDIPTDIADGDQDTDTLGDLALFCLEGDVPKWLGGTWGCAADTDTNTQLTEQAVEGFVTNGPLDLHVATTLGGASILTSTACLLGELLSWDGAAWQCTAIQSLVDADSDGSLAWSDCDDLDPAIPDQALDGDCDGILTYDDCDDNDSNSTVVATDGDCDGTLTDDDCDDNDSNSTIVAVDADCDGSLTVDDCDDADESVFPGAGETCNGADDDCDGTNDNGLDNDGDGVTPCGPDGITDNSDDDCDDANGNIFPGASEVCDGVDNDCDDVIDDDGLGGTLLCAEVSCAAVLQADPSAPDGVYWLDPDGDGGVAPYQIYCLQSVDGGGWEVQAYLRQQGHWDTGVFSDFGTVGDTASGFASGSTLQSANSTYTEKIIVYQRLIEQGSDLGQQWMVNTRTAGSVTYNGIDSSNGWSYRDSFGNNWSNAGNVCTHGCGSFRTFGMFAASSDGHGYHGTQGGDYGCADGNNICWDSRGLSCNVGSARCSLLSGSGEGVIYAVR